MINVEQICAPQEDWTDTAEQAQLRACLIGALKGRSEVDQIRIGRDLIDLMRDQLMRGTADVRQAACELARQTMSPAEIAKESGMSGPTISRLLTRAKTDKKKVTVAELKAEVARLKAEKVAFSSPEGS